MREHFVGAVSRAERSFVRILKSIHFLILYDAIEPVRFFLFCSHDGGKLVSWMTNLGQIAQQLQRYAWTPRFLLLEPDYDKYYPGGRQASPIHQKRIRGRYGHLSNESAFNLIANAERPCWQKIFLAPLNCDCNRANIASSLSGQDLCEHFYTSIVDPFNAIP